MSSFTSSFRERSYESSALIMRFVRNRAIAALPCEYERGARVLALRAFYVPAPARMLRSYGDEGREDGALIASAKCGHEQSLTS